MGKYNPADKSHKTTGIYLSPKLNQTMRAVINQRPHLTISEIVRNGVAMWLEKEGFIPRPQPVDDPTPKKPSEGV